MRIVSDGTWLEEGWGGFEERKRGVCWTMRRRARRL